MSDEYVSDRVDDHEREIERLSDRIDVLERMIERLGEQIDRLSRRLDEEVTRRENDVYDLERKVDAAERAARNRY